MSPKQIALDNFKNRFQRSTQRLCASNALSLNDRRSRHTPGGAVGPQRGHPSEQVLPVLPALTSIQ